MTPDGTTREADARLKNTAVYALNKVPAATLAFWVAKVLATTLGETAGDAVSMTLGLGYAVSSLLFLGFFLLRTRFPLLSMGDTR